MTITAKIIADSISEAGIRIATLELEYPRFIHSQFMTHRQFSRNAQSSRAIPTKKQIELIRDLPAPEFAKNQAGMQAGEKLNVTDNLLAIDIWNSAKDDAIACAESLLILGVHKQWANRLLEPFATIKVVVTATEWDNFFELRLDHAAQPEMQELAQAMKTAMDEQTTIIRRLKSGEWHLPYLSRTEIIEMEDSPELALISAARCARVSYLNHDNSNPDIEKDLELANQLLKDGHLSPFEHQAMPMKEPIFSEYEGKINLDNLTNGMTHIDANLNCWSTNFRGWISHRQIL